MTNGAGTLRELLTWWLTEYSHGTPSHATNVSTINKHIMTSDLAGLALISVASEGIERFLLSKRNILAPETINHLRGYLNRVSNAAIRVGRFNGVNPVTKVPKRREDRRKKFDYLRKDEVLGVLS